jgi:ABC-type Na+ efflux pump permease subunit
MKNRNGQQEMVGFVLIVVLVVVGLMVFLVISLRDSPEMEKSIEVGNMLDSIINESLRAVLDAMFATEATVGAYQIDFFVKDEEGDGGLLRIVEGNCSGSVSSAQRSVVSHSDSLIIRMKVCSASSV